MTDDDVVAARMGGPLRRITHGRWALEVRGDEVAEIRYDGVRLLRAIRPVVRDRDWNTVPVATVAEELPDNDAAGVVTRLRFEADGIAYEGSVGLRLCDDELTVDFDGRAVAGFERNRIGLVVLHPAADAGHAVRVLHADGRTTSGSWPTEISPHQPFRDVAGFEWTKDGVTATLTLTGDVFETEDQRNWTDASFKTYSTPLSLPFPVAVPLGATCHQAARLTATGHGAASAPDDEDHVTVTSDVLGSMPPISVGAGFHPSPDFVPELPGPFETVVVELTGSERHWPDRLRSASRQARALGARLDVRIVTAEPAAVERCIATLADLPVVRLGVFDPHGHISTPDLWAALGNGVRQHGLHVQLVGGTRAHFTELNRRIGDIPVEVPALTFSVTPQMHSTEVPHIVDSLGTQRTVGQNARRLAQGRPVFVGPITLARRFNAVATTAPEPAVDAERAVDPLQPTGFTAAWTVGSVCALAPTGVSGLCYFELGGPRGIVGPDGTATPAGRVLAELARLRGLPLLRSSGPADLPVLAVETADDGAVELFVANLSARLRTVTVDGAGRSTVTVRPWSVEQIRVSAEDDR